VDTSLEASLTSSVGPPSIGESVVVASLARSVVTKASPLNSTLGKFTLTTGIGSVFARAAGRTAADHLETGRESLEASATVGDVTITTVLVVDEKTAVCNLGVGVG